MEKNKGGKGLKFALESKDLLAGAAFPVMLMMIISVTFIGLISSLVQNDVVVSIIMLVIGEVFVGVSLVIFGRQSGVTSVRRLVQNTKKRDMGAGDRAAELCVGEYSAYKGFLIGFISCIPYIIFQLVQCCYPNTFCNFVLEYVFGWAAYPLYYAGLSPWFNFIMILYPIAVHGVAYIIGAHLEWNKVTKLQQVNGEPGKEDKDGAE